MDDLQRVTRIVVGGAGIARDKGVVVDRLHQSRRIGRVFVLRLELVGIHLAVAVEVIVPVGERLLGERDRSATDGLGVALDGTIKLLVQIGDLLRETFLTAIAVEVATRREREC